jgi:cytochrome b subunit of formate dehydrogenase
VVLRLPDMSTLQDTQTTSTDPRPPVPERDGGVPLPAPARPTRLPRVLALALTLACAALGVRAWDAPAAEPTLPGSDECAMCHQPGKGTRRVAGEAPNFDAAGLRASPHAGLECAACHKDLQGGEFPHAERLHKVECGDCHADEQEQHDESLHGVAFRRGERLAPTCVSCHGRHDVLRPGDPRSATNTMNIPELCNRCHREGSPVQSFYHIPQDSILKNYTESIHGQGLFQKGLLTTAVCTSCHTAHHQLPHTDPRSSIAHDKVATTCMQCHVRIEQVHRKIVNGALWAKGTRAVPACVDCHQPHKVRKVFYNQGMADADCMSCHGKKDLEGHDDKGREVSMYVDAAQLQHSRHQRIACAQCHTGAAPSKLRPCSTVTSKVDCSTCHAEVVGTYDRSIHGQLAAKGSPDAPRCADCHGTHGIRGKAEPDSRTFARRIPDLCGDCHLSGHKAALRYTGDQTRVVESYVESIHGKGLLQSGLVVTATCVDCHSAHGELPKADPASTVNPKNVAQTCATCHRGIYDLFEASVHSPSVSKHPKDKLPTCSDCHSAHQVARTDKTDFKLVVMDQCGQCHEELAQTYFDTYHGKVSKLGYAKTAKCYDCHGAHDILPTHDPRSHLSRERIVETCAKCHPGSNRRFAGYLTHATHHDPRKYPALFYTFWGMTGLLVGTFLFAGLHTLAWLPRSLAYRRDLVRTHALESAQHVRRFPKLYRNLHLMVIVSFISLALTGMTLKFSYAPWAGFVARALGGFEAAGFVHRVAALVTFAYFGIHVADLIRRRRESGQSWVKFATGPSGMMFSLTDLKEFWGSVMWFLGKGKRPQYGRWTYWEKFDYFAVFWGVAVIGLSGLLLWFPTVFTKILPGWLLNVATIVHSDEALLAVGFIFTVHFFNTHFRPEKFPMDTVIFTGTIPLDEFKTDRPREYEELVRTGRLEELLVPAPDPKGVRKWRIFGTVALSLGLLLIVGILYAAIFGYR